MRLCALCRDFSLTNLVDSKDSTQSRRLSSIEKGTRDKCDFCIFLYDQIEAQVTRFAVRPDECWLRIRALKSSAHFEHDETGCKVEGLAIRLADSPLERKFEQKNEEIFLGLAAETGSPAAQTNDVVGRYYGDLPGSPEHLAGILEWLGPCLNHRQCRLTPAGDREFDASDVPLPTRCIDLIDASPCLRETSELRGSYVALSHRWTNETGNSSTTEANIGNRLVAQGIDDLPLVFNDVISITRTLGIRYLWIDSLCIIQSGDGGSDWLKEAARMSTYYQQAILTISLPNVQGSRGLFSHRRAKAFRSLTQLSYRDRCGKQDGVFYVYRPTHTTPDTYSRLVQQSDLSTRGWVFQERILSRRVVHFTRREMFFECQVNGPRGERGGSAFAVGEQRLNLSAILRSPGFDSWYRLVEMYTKTSLTRPEKDHIIAISGIAMEFRQKLRYDRSNVGMRSLQYGSGLWRDDLHYGLLWQNLRPKYDPCSCGAPSWSWAAILGSVQWLPRALKATRVLEIKEMLAANDTDGMSSTTAAAADTETISGSHEVDLEDSTTMTKLDEVLKSKFMLKVYGSIVPLYLNSSLPKDRDTLKILARETGVELPKDEQIWEDRDSCYRATDWQVLCSMENLEVICGWALLDDPNYTDAVASCDGYTILALHVSTRTKNKTMQYAMGVANDVCDVLYIEPLGDEKYRRIGVGRIMQDRMLSASQFMQSKDITLI